MGPTQRRESPATAMPVLHIDGQPKRSLVVCLITRLIARSWRRLQTVYVLGIAIRDDSNDQGRQLAQRAYEALDRGALDELSWLYTPDIEMITPDETVKGLDDVGAFFEAVRTAFPDISHRLVSAVESEGLVACEWVVSGTHLGPLATSDGTVPATSQPFQIALADFLTIKAGRIARSVSYWDNDMFLAQLGLR